jgi:Dolichyl-phosphate-mannose-protein mannosyltransferase
MSSSAPGAARPSTQETTQRWLDERGRDLVRAVRRLETSPWVPAFAVLLATAFLFRRMAPDVSRRPIFVDEVLAGLTAINPLPEIVEVVLFERGGAPLHFVLAHFALLADPSTEALRWMSVAFALATIPVCYDLGRRLGGRVAGVTAAFVVSTSSMIEVWGTMGRMYAVFVFTAALAADLFARALEKRTFSASLVAALVALLVPATHPYGIILVGVEGAVALAVWRGRPFLRGLPIALLSLALVPFLIADLRLSERFGVSVAEESSAAPPEEAGRLFLRALAGYAGGGDGYFAVFVALGIGGIAVLARRNLHFTAFAVGVLLAVPVLLVLVRAGRTLTEIRPNHLIFGLPLWAALIGVGVAYALRSLPRSVVVAGVLSVAFIGAVAPAGIKDPRVRVDAMDVALERPAAWLRAEVEEDSILVFHSPVSLAALSSVKDATSIPHTGRPLRSFERADYPSPEVIIALPRGTGTKIDRAKLAAKLGPGAEFEIFRHWIMIRKSGPFPDAKSAVTASIHVYDAARRSASPASAALTEELRSVKTLCGVLRKLGGRCAATFVRFPPPPP